MEENNLDKQLQTMSKRLKRLEWTMLVVLVVVLILAGQIYKILNTSEDDPVSGFLTDALKSTLAETVKDAYNTGDEEVIYKILGPYAQTMHTPEQIEAMVKGLEMVGPIEKSTYTHAEYLGYDQGADWYKVYYVAKFQNGVGGLRITIRVVDDQWEIVGFFLNVDRLITY